MAEHWSDRFHASIVRYAIPLIFGDRPHPRQPTHQNTATAVAIDAGAGAFLLTAAHVIKHALARAEHPRFHFMVGPVGISVADRVIGLDEERDLATLRISDREVAALEDDGLQIVRPSEWPLRSPSEGSAIILAGFPGEWRTELSWHESNLSCTIIRTFVVATTENQFTTHLEPQYTLHRQLNASIAAPEVALPGLSGGPAFLEPDADALLVVPHLCGIVKEGSSLLFAPGNHVLFYARLDRLKRDGSLSAPDA